MARILVVEDSLEAQALVRRALASYHELHFASSGDGGIREAVAAPPELILVDVGLPDIDGFELCTRMKSNPVLEDIPVIFLTGRGDTADKVMAFKLGADDFVPKPFDPAELRARIEARLRNRLSSGDRIAFDDMTLDVIRQEVLLHTSGEETPCELTPHEFRILHGLAARRGVVVTRSQLIEVAWGGVSITERTVDTHVSNLRKKLGGLGYLVEAVRGVGYRLVEASPRAGLAPASGDL